MKNLPIIFLIFFITSCHNQDCDKISTTFSSYEDAEQVVNHANFKYKDNVNTSKSSWIRGARFYSCDNIHGFFVLETDKENYIYQNIPFNIWKGFKNAESFGTYYNKFIKNRYKLLLTD